MNRSRVVRMQRFFSQFLVISLCLINVTFFIAPTPALAQDEPEYCQSGIYNPDGIIEDESAFASKLERIQTLDYQAFVGAVATTDGQDIEESLLEILAPCSSFTNNNGAVKSNVVAIMVASEDRKTRIQAGAKLVAFLPGYSGSASGLEGLVNSRFKEGEFTEGLGDGLGYIESHIKDGSALKQETPSQQNEEEEGSNLGMIFLTLLGIFLIYKVISHFLETYRLYRFVRERHDQQLKEIQPQLDAGKRQMGLLLGDFMTVEEDASYISSLVHDDESDKIRTKVVQLKGNIDTQHQHWIAQADNVAKLAHNNKSDLTGCLSTVATLQQENTQIDTSFRTLADSLSAMRQTLRNCDTIAVEYETEQTQATQLRDRVIADNWPVEPAADKIDNATDLGASAARSFETKHLLTGYASYRQAIVLLREAQDWLSHIDQHLAAYVTKHRELGESYDNTYAQFDQAQTALEGLRKDYAESSWEDVATDKEEAAQYLDDLPDLLAKLEQAVERDDIKWAKAEDTSREASVMLREIALFNTGVLEREQQIYSIVEHWAESLTSVDAVAERILTFIYEESLEITDDLEHEIEATVKEISDVARQADKRKPDMLAATKKLQQILAKLVDLEITAQGEVNESYDNRIANANAWEDAHKAVKDFKKFLRSFKKELADKRVNRFYELEVQFDAIADQAITPTEGVINVVSEYEEIEQKLRELALKIHKDQGYEDQYDDEAQALAVGYILESVIDSEPYYRDFASYHETSGSDWSSSSGGGGGGGSFSGGGSTSSW